MRRRGVSASRPLTLWWFIAVLLAGVGGVGLGVGLAGQEHAPQPSASQAQALPAPVTVTMTTTIGADAIGSARSSPGQTAGTVRSATRPSRSPRPAISGQSSPTSAPLALTASVPLAINIPSIGVQSAVVQLGLNADNSIQVPPLDDPESKAGWYKHSPTPGQIGPSVILGHVDSARYGPAVFFELGALQPGADVEVTLTNGMVAVFTVDKVVAYPKSAFPSAAVYGNIDHPGLRLITCGGKFDPAAGSYESNIVAYASLTSDRPSG